MVPLVRPTAVPSATVAGVAVAGLLLPHGEKEDEWGEGAARAANGEPEPTAGDGPATSDTPAIAPDFVHALVRVRGL